MATIHDLQQTINNKDTSIIIDPNVLAKQGVSYEQQEKIYEQEKMMAAMEENENEQIFVEGSGKHHKNSSTNNGQGKFKNIVPLTQSTQPKIIKNPPTMAVSKNQMQVNDETTETMYESRYEPDREATKRARFDDNGKVVDPLQESLNLIEIHAQRKVREMEQYFAEHPEDFPENEISNEEDDLNETEETKEYLKPMVESENPLYTKTNDNIYVDEDELELEKEIEMDMANAENNKKQINVNNEEPAPVDEELLKKIEENNAKSEEYADELLSNISEDEMNEALDDFKNEKTPYPAAEMESLRREEEKLLNEQENNTNEDNSNDIVNTGAPTPNKLYKENTKEEAAKNIIHMELPKEEVIHDTKNMNFDEDDFKDLEEDDLEEEKDDEDSEELKYLQKDITDKIQILSDKIDLSTFTISKKPISVGTALSVVHDNGIECSTWALMSSGRPIKMRSFMGVEMEELSDAANENYIMTLDRVNKLYGLLYEHDMNPNKPAKLVDWLKCTSFIDLDDLYMAAYVSTFRKSNHIPYNCEKCTRMWITDNRPIMDVVKFENDAAEREFNRIINLAPQYNSNFYNVTLVPISDSYVFAFKTPSIFDAIYKYAVLDIDFRRKYSNMLATMQFIDDIYLVNKNDKTLQPIEKKEYPNNLAKTVKAEVLAYAKIIRTLTSDQHTTLAAYVNEINLKSVPGKKKINYVIPESTCERCGTVNKEKDITARELLFTRHQLTVLRTV